MGLSVGWCLNYSCTLKRSIINSFYALLNIIIKIVTYQNTQIEIQFWIQFLFQYGDYTNVFDNFRDVKSTRPWNGLRVGHANM